jgi:hypothetical protein
MKPGAETGLASNAWFRIIDAPNMAADDVLDHYFPICLMEPAQCGRGQD